VIAITFALPTESKSFARALSGADDDRCEIFHTGVGATECRRRLVPFFESNHPRIVVASGFAGSLSDELSVGDIVIAQNFSSPELRDAAARILTSARTITMWTTDAIVYSREERLRIAREHGAVAVDMETACIATECAARSIPILSIRVISDSPREPLPAPAHVLFDLATQRTNPLALLAYVVTHPSALNRLPRFARQIERAKNSLASALLAVVSELGAS